MGEHNEKKRSMSRTEVDVLTLLRDLKSACSADGPRASSSPAGIIANSIMIGWPAIRPSGSQMVYYYCPWSFACRVIRGRRKSLEGGDQAMACREQNMNNGDTLLGDGAKPCLNQLLSAI